MKLSLPRTGLQARKKAAKKAVLKTVFNSRDHKRVVDRAARESAMDQQKLMKRYHDAKG